MMLQGVFQMLKQQSRNIKNRHPYAASIVLLDKIKMVSLIV